ncbi:MAG: protein kinase, partial [Planctomycetota bacterium]
MLGDYKLLYKAAAGGFARVFRAVSLEDGRSCALKLLKEGRSSEDGEVARFYREAKLLKRLRHRNIVPIYDIGQVGDSHFFTMEFVGGGNLKDLVRTRGAYAGGEATAIVYQIVAGLAA